jgi:hypothetical protein
MTADSLTACYRILELRADADAIALRHQYRKLAQRLHPDRAGGSADAFQQLQDAYATLLRFHKENGYLPLQQPAEKAPLLQPGQGIRRHAVTRKPFWKRIRFWLASATTIALLSLWWPHAPPPAPPTPAPTSARPAANDDIRTFSVGASLADVIDIQGIPEQRHENTWYYGASRIYFHEGKVSGWLEDPSFPLRLAPGHPVSLLPDDPQ